MRTASYIDRTCNFLVPIVAGIILAKLAISSAPAALCVAVGGLVFGLVARNPIRALGLFILVIPFSGTLLMGRNLSSMPGTKPFQLLAVLVAVAAIWNANRAQRIPRRGIVFTLLFLALFTTCVLRALPNIEHISIDLDAAPSTTSFLLTHYVKPLIFFLPFIIIPLYCRTVDDVDQVVRFLAAATVGLTVFLLYLHIFRGAGSRDVGVFSDVYAQHLGLHRNGLGSLFMVGFPFLVARFFIRKSFFNAAAILLAVAAIAILFCRTAYVTLALCPLLYAVVSKRATVVPMALALLLAFFLLMPSTVSERAMRGLESRDLNKILAGRVHHAWMPLLHEYLADPASLVFGRGRYAMLSSAASQRGLLLQAKHPHNLYLEVLFETGLLGLIFSLLFLGYVLTRFAETLNRPGDPRLREYRYAVAVSAACYFIGGLTGRSLFPVHDGGFFWVMMAIAAVIPMMSPTAEPRPDSDECTLSPDACAAS